MRVSSVPVGSATAATAVAGVAAQGGKPAGGLDVVFRGVEVFEVRARGAAGWKTVAAWCGVAGLVLLTISLWTRDDGGSANDMSTAQLQQAFLATCVTVLSTIFTIRRTGVVWRFDHRRKTITRRHWLRGLSRRWPTRKVAGVAVVEDRSRLGTPVVQLRLFDPAGKVVAQLGGWDHRRVDLAQVQSVVGEIKRVMWWK
jgi:hypothetical protein